MRQIKTVASVLTVLTLLCCYSIPVFAEVGFGIKGGMWIPDQDPFKDEFDSDMLLGGVLEMDSNLGLTLEANVEYYQQDGKSGGDITIFPLIVMAKYNFAPRYRTTPFVGMGIGTYFFDRKLNGTSRSTTRFGTRVAGGLRFLEDRRMNLVIEAAKNFVDFDHMNAGSFQVTLSILFDFYPGIVGTP
jgi:opacity protein-like surface antigen